MLKMCPDLDEVPLIGKVEAFQAALQSTPADDIGALRPYVMHVCGVCVCVQLVCAFMRV